MSKVEAFLAITYIAYIASPIIRDELIFRLALLLTSVGFVAWGFWVDERVVILANALFVVLSLRHIIRLVRQRQPVHLSRDQNHIYTHLFATMTPREFLTLWELGERITLPSGNIIVRDHIVDDVMVVINSDVVVELDTGDRAAEAPVLLGEMSYALGESAPATATVRSDVPVEVVRWTKAALRDLERSHPDLAVPFLASLGQNLARKVRL